MIHSCYNNIKDSYYDYFSRSNDSRNFSEDFNYYCEFSSKDSDFRMNIIKNLEEINDELSYDDSMEIF